VKALNPSIVSAFTATAGPSIVEAIEKISSMRKVIGLSLQKQIEVNLLYGVLPSLSILRTLRQLLCTAKTLIILNVLARLSNQAAQIHALGYQNVRFYHAGLSRTERKKVETWFQDSTEGILVSTNAYGMGMDKKTYAQ